MRLNLELDKAQIDSLKALQKRLGESNMKVLINDALTLIEWAADEVAKGNEIVSLNEQDKGYRVLVTPYLQYVAKLEGPAGKQKAQEEELVTIG